jgi:hypothetical protein
MRTQAHIIDTKAVKAVMSQLPDHWVVRELSERDYGIDLLVEIFVPGAKDSNGKDAFEASGAIFHVQIKGTSEALTPVAAGSINYSIEKRSLRYVEKFSSPFFLFRVSVVEPITVYFLWIQRYIKEAMDVNDPYWRDSAKDSITVRIPKSNELQAGLERIEEIAFRPKYIEELVEYFEIHENLTNQLDAIRSGDHPMDPDLIERLRNSAYRIRRLTVLIGRNNCCVRKESIDELIQYIGNLNAAEGLAKPYPHSDNFRLLADSLSAVSMVELMISENEGLSTY